MIERALSRNKSHTSGGTGAASIASNAVSLIGVQSLNIVTRAIYVVVVARYLGPEIYGIFAFGHSWYLAFLPAATFGTGLVLSREIGKRGAAHDSIVGDTLSLTAITTLLSAVFCFLLGPLMAGGNGFVDLIGIFALALVGRGIASWTQNLFVASESARFALVQSALFRPLEVVTLLVLLHFGAGLLEVIVLHAAVWWLQALYGILIVRAQLIGCWRGFNFKPVLRLFVLSLPLFLSQITFVWLMQGSMVLSRHMQVDGADSGILALAVQVMTLSAIIPTAVSTVALPVLSRSAHRGDGQDMRFVELYGSVSLVVGIGAAVIVQALAPPLVPVLMGDAYAGAASLMGLAVANAALYAAGGVCFRALIAQGGSWLAAQSGLIGVAVLVVSFKPLLDQFGLAGCLMAATCGITVWMMLCVYFLSRNGLRWQRSLVRPALLAAAIVALAALLPHSPVITGLTGVLGTGISLLFLGLTARSY